MDWNFAIETHREALRRIVAMLVAMAGLADSDFPVWVPRSEARESFSLPRHLHRTLLRLLRAAEAAARRLIVVAARGLVVLPGPLRPAKPQSISPYGRSGPVLTPSVALPQQRPRRPILPLIDPLRDGSGRWRPAATSVPRISVPGWSDPSRLAIRPTPTADDPLDAAGIHRRLAALGAALDDLPRQTKRLARWGSRRPRGKFNRVMPLRGGRPPGWRKPDSRHAHPIHPALHDLHGLALWVQEKPDTS